MSAINQERPPSEKKPYLAPGFVAVKAFNRSSLLCNCGPLQDELSESPCSFGSFNEGIPVSQCPG